MTKVSEPYVVMSFVYTKAKPGHMDEFGAWGFTAGPVCGFPSSVSDGDCILPQGHAADSALRFHRFAYTTSERSHPLETT